MKKFEYKTFQHHLINSARLIEHRLSEFGQDGWEVISIVQFDTNMGSKPNILVTMKREVRG